MSMQERARAIARQAVTRLIDALAATAEDDAPEGVSIARIEDGIALSGRRIAGSGWLRALIIGMKAR